VIITIFRVFVKIRQQKTYIYTHIQNTATAFYALTDCLINSSVLPANLQNMESYFLLICIGAFVY